MTQVHEAPSLLWIYDMIKNNNVYYCWYEGGERLDHPWICYWNPDINGWDWSYAGKHIVLSQDPLTLEPSVGWHNKHGWIREGKWYDA